MDRGSPYKIHWWRIVACVAVLACMVVAAWLLRGRDERPASEQTPIAQERDLQNPVAQERDPPAMSTMDKTLATAGGTRFSASASPASSRGERLPEKMSRRLAGSASGDKSRDCRGDRRPHVAWRPTGA